MDALPVDLPNLDIFISVDSLCVTLHVLQGYLYKSSSFRISLWLTGLHLFAVAARWGCFYVLTVRGTIGMGGHMQGFV